MSLSSFMRKALKNGCTISSRNGVRFVSRQDRRVKITRTKHLILDTNEGEFACNERQAYNFLTEGEKNKPSQN